MSQFPFSRCVIATLVLHLDDTNMFYKLRSNTRQWIGSFQFLLTHKLIWIYIKKYILQFLDWILTRSLVSWWQHYEPFTGWSSDIVLDAVGVSLSVVFLPEGPSRLRDTDRERTAFGFSSHPPAYQPPVKQPNLALTPAQTSTCICQHWFLQSAPKQLAVCAHTYTAFLHGRVSSLTCSRLLHTWSCHENKDDQHF